MTLALGAVALLAGLLEGELVLVVAGVGLLVVGAGDALEGPR